jgi:hypothetical protein
MLFASVAMILLGAHYYNYTLLLIGVILVFLSLLIVTFAGLYLYKNYKEIKDEI